MESNSWTGKYVCLNQERLVGQIRAGGICVKAGRTVVLENNFVGSYACFHNK